MDSDITPMVLETLLELAAEEELSLPEGLDRSTPLFAKDGLLDSLALVSLLVALEQRLEDEYGIQVSLADERAMSQKRSPFATVGSLAEYGESLLAAERVG